MTAVPFDTYSFIKRLTASGMPESQAETVTTLVKEARETDTGQLANTTDIQLIKIDVQLIKTDLQLVKTDIQLVKTDIQLVKTDIQLVKVGLQLLEQRMTIKLGGLIMVATGVILTAIKFLR